jgi:AcrR family transcriptional regulator/DNA-binding transcriptional regulator YdaS (Cro superfamily)
MSLRELARRISASPSLISQIENGKTRLTVVRLRAIAQALGVREQNLFSDGPLVAASSAATTHLLTAEVDPAGDAEWRRYEPLQLDPVLTATLASILETGYHGSSVRDIAARCGLSVPGLYHYYPSKQAMLVALLDLTMTDLLRRSRGAIAEGQDSVERFSQLVECLALYHSHRQQLAFVGASEMRSLEPASRRRIAAMRMEQQAMVDREVEAAVEQGRFASRRPHEASRAVVTMCTAIAQWFQPRGPLTPEQIAEHYVEFALDLMRVTTAG